MKPADIIAAVRALGSDAGDLRDAAHEAHHALDARVPRGRWDRQTIDRAVFRMGAKRAAFSEVMARAVEQLVCADLGVPCDSVEDYAAIAVLEAAGAGLDLGSANDFAALVRHAMGTRVARRAADAVTALALAPPGDAGPPRRATARRRR